MSSLIFEKSRKGRAGFAFPEEKSLKGFSLPAELARTEPLGLPEVSEVDVVRHYSQLERKNYGVDYGFYPLGSCTMKYNPKINEDIAAFSGFTNLHPLADPSDAQGTMGILHKSEELLCEITGMDAGTLQPFAGAHGEFTALKLFKAYFLNQGQPQRTKILIPDSAHGTNPASANVAGFEVIEIASDKNGLVDIEALKPHLNDQLAGIMLTNPNTLGLYEKDIHQIAKLIHEAGGLLYYDGANLNAVLGESRPGDMGFDAIHLNLHKTFSTPHGGGGPGSGPVLVKSRLTDFLPSPGVEKREDGYGWKCFNHSIGRISGFHGNVGIVLRAYAYILTMGKEGLKRVAELAVLNANYLKEALKEDFYLPYDRTCMHEFVLSAQKIKDEYGITALDIAKGLADRGIHPPTIYFPLIIPEAMMIEPTETEPKENLDRFIDAMKNILHLAKEAPDELKQAPTNAPVRRVDEVLAAKQLKLIYKPE